MSTTLVVNPPDSKPVRIKRETLNRLMLADTLLRSAKDPQEVADALGLPNKQALYSFLHDNGYGLGRVSYVRPRPGMPELGTLAAQLEE